jgi:hypothetical protein
VEAAAFMESHFILLVWNAAGYVQLLQPCQHA